MNSGIYTGKVRHRRFSPKGHEFKYRLYMNWLDLDEIPKLFKIPLLMASGKFPALIKFNRKKYFSPEVTSLKSAVIEKIHTELGFRPQGKVCILTTLQYFGLCYNPVSFYFAYDKEDNLQAVAAEINNTPWDQRFTYCLDMRTKKTHRFKKDFHISPFMPMEMNYKWHFSHPGEHLNIHMQNFTGSELIFDATLKLKKEKFSTAGMLKCAILYPLIPLKMISGIYWHAFRLWLKKTPFYSHPETINENKEYTHE